MTEHPENDQTPIGEVLRYLNTQAVAALRNGDRDDAESLLRMGNATHAALEYFHGGGKLENSRGSERGENPPAVSNF